MQGAMAEEMQLRELAAPLVWSNWTKPTGCGKKIVVSFAVMLRMELELRKRGETPRQEWQRTDEPVTHVLAWDAVCGVYILRPAGATDQ